MGLLYQIFGTAIICSLGIDMGVIFAWPATAITLFGSENTTLDRPMTETEISLLGSLSCIGGIISTLVCGLTLDKLGRKKSALIGSICMVLFWTILTVSRQVEVVLTSIFLSGIASGVILVASLYISEICQDSIRGAMTSANMVTYGAGMLLSYVLGGYVRYDVILYVGLTMSIISVGLLFIIKDSPVYLLQIGREKEAAEAIAFFRQLKVTDKEVIEEISIIRSALNPDLDNSTPEEEKLQKDLKPVEKLSFWQFMKKSQCTRRALFVNLVVITGSIFQGLVVVQIYVEVLFVEAVPSISPTTGSVLMAAVIVVAGVVGSYLTDVAGRRFLMIYGSIGAAISCVLLGTQLQCHWGPSWLTALFIYVFSAIFSLGSGTVPYVLLAELFLPEIKSIVSMLILEWAWLCNFVILFIINPLLKALGWGPVFYIFAVISFLTALFCMIFLPETKGLTVNEIQPLFLKKKASKPFLVY